MNTLGFSDLDTNLRIFVSVVEQWFPVAVGIAGFAGLAVMFAATFLRARH